MPNAHIHPDDDQVGLFSAEEYVQALGFVCDAETARIDGHALARPHPEGKGLWLSPDVLDLLSLVSDDCAARVAKIMELSPEEAKKRREAVARGVGREV